MLGNAGEQLNISKFSLRLDVKGGEKLWGTFFPGNKIINRSYGNI